MVFFCWLRDGSVERVVHPAPIPRPAAQPRPALWRRGQRRQLRLRRGAGPAAAAPAAAAPAAALWVPTQAPGFPGSRGVGPASGWCSGGSLPGDASHAKEMKGRRMLGCESSQFDVRRDGTGKLCNVGLPRERRGRGAGGRRALGGCRLRMLIATAANGTVLLTQEGP